MNMDVIPESFIQNLRRELNARKIALIEMSKNPRIQMEDEDRRCIKEFLEKGGSHPRPQNVAHLLKVLLTSTCSYWAVRRYLTRLVNDIPSDKTIAKAISLALEDCRLLLEANWTPNKLAQIGNEIMVKNGYSIKSRGPKERITTLLIYAPTELNKHIGKKGLDGFYQEIEEVCSQKPESMWKYVKNISENIPHVGANLTCDFLKNIGFVSFVKIDWHMLQEVKGWSAKLFNGKKLSDKEAFILSVHLAKTVGMTPFHFDHILYQWGRYGKKTPN